MVVVVHQTVAVMETNFLQIMTYLILWILIFMIWVKLCLTKPSFEIQKSRLMNLYSSILSDMNIDFRDQWIWARNLSDISKSIQNFSSEVDILSKHIRKENPENQKWLVEILQEFNTNLHIWIDRHAIELIELETSISEFKKTHNSEKYILELTEKRLENHIKILQKI